MSISDLRSAILLEGWVDEVTEELGRPPGKPFSKAGVHSTAFGDLTELPPGWFAPRGKCEQHDGQWCYDNMPYVEHRGYYCVKLAHYVEWCGHPPDDEVTPLRLPLPTPPDE